MTTKDETAATTRRQRLLRWAAGVLVVAGYGVGCAPTGSGGDDAARDTSDAVVDAMNNGESGVLNNLSCWSSEAMPDVEGEASVADLDHWEDEKNDVTGAVATVETTRVGEYYSLTLLDGDDGWCLGKIEACYVDGATEDNSYLPPCRLTED
ncbi:hypothetical protein [Streptomyces sp. 6N223]|uniref:hypothetical protein n=1 Tax=Streptomyces sp. 6N223 TaxID=3457412 RepID=UPI003FD5BB09